jgi:hypothetical protein
MLYDTKFGLYDTKFGHTTQIERLLVFVLNNTNLVVRHTFGRTAQNSVVRHKIQLYDTKFSRTTQNLCFV